MRRYLHIDLGNRSVTTEELEGEAIIRAGRHFIAKTLLERGVAKVDPLSPENPLIFSAGPFAGSNFSNANRLSVGCKSPLTGGIKESNSGGTFAFALGQLEIAGLTLYGASRRLGRDPHPQGRRHHLRRRRRPISARAISKSPRSCSRNTARRSASASAARSANIAG